MSPPTDSDGPLPQIKMARTDWSSAIRLATTSDSAAMRGSIALWASGRFRQTVANPSATE